MNLKAQRVGPKSREHPSVLFFLEVVLIWNFGPPREGWSSPKKGFWTTHFVELDVLYICGQVYFLTKSNFKRLFLDKSIFGSKICSIPVLSSSHTQKIASPKFDLSKHREELVRWRTIMYTFCRAQRPLQKLCTVDLYQTNSSQSCFWLKLFRILRQLFYSNNRGSKLLRNGVIVYTF